VHAVIAITVAVFGSLLATPPAPIEAERRMPIAHEASSAHNWISKR